MPIAMPKGKLRSSDFRRLLSVARPYRVHMAVALVSLLAAGACGLAMPQALRRLVDAAVTGRDGPQLNSIMLTLIAILVSQVCFGFLKTYLLSVTSERIVADIRVQLSHVLLGQSAGFYTSRSVGELTSRVSSDVGMLSYAVTGSLGELIRQSLLLLGSVAIIASMNLRLTLVMLSIVPIVAVAAMTLYGGYLRNISAMVQDGLAEAAGALESALATIRVVQSFVREGFEEERYRVKIHGALTLAIRRSLVVSLFTAAALLLVFLGLAGVLWVGSRMVLSGEMTAGALSAFVVYMFVVAFTVTGIVDLFGTFQQAIGSSRRVFELLDSRSEITDPPAPVSLTRVAGHVSLEQVSVRYSDDGPDVLADISLNASPGELVAIVGPSGAGKTTLILLLLRFYDVTRGAVRIDGHDVRSLSLRDLRQAIGLVPQETALFAGTIRENIAYGDLTATDDAVEAAARAANAHEFIIAMPGGYDAVVGERGMTLSGGQRQRIAIARAVLKDPAILVLDEATSALDSESERQVQQALDGLMQGRTTFVIAHRLSTVRRANKIVVLDRGRLVEIGTHDELLANNGLFKALHELQFREIEAPAAEPVEVVS